MPTQYELNVQLWDAIEARDLSAIKHAISRGADVTAIDRKDGFSALTKAVYNSLDRENIEIVRYLSSNKEALDATNADGSTALMHAPRNDGYDANVSTLLVKSGANTQAVDNNGQTALMRMIDEKPSYYAIGELFTQQTGPINAQDKTGETALMKAAKNQNLAAVRLLLKNGANVNLTDNEGHSAVTMAITKEGNTSAEIIRRLIKAGAKPTEEDLKAAIEAGRTDITQMLISSGVKPHGSMLYAAIDSGKPELVQVLLNGGANACDAISDDDENSPILYAMQKDVDPSIIGLLSEQDYSSIQTRNQLVHRLQTRALEYWEDGHSCQSSIDCTVQDIQSGQANAAGTLRASGAQDVIDTKAPIHNTGHSMDMA